MTEEPREAARNFRAGNGLVRTGDDLDVVGTADRIDVYENNVDISANYKGQESIEVLSPKVYERIQKMIEDGLESVTDYVNQRLTPSNPPSGNTGPTA